MEKTLEETIGEQIQDTDEPEALAPMPEPAGADEPVQSEESGAGDDADKGRDEKGRFAKKDEKPEEKPTEVKPEEKPAEQQAEQQVVEEDVPVVGDLNRPPSSWTAQARAQWQDLPERIRREVKKREQDVSKGFEQYKARAEFGDTIEKEIRPYEAMIRSEGGTPETAVRELFNTAYRLRQGTPQQKAALVLGLAQQFGADMLYIYNSFNRQQGQQDPVQTQNQIDAAVQQRMQQEQERRQAEEQQKEQQEAQARVEAFENELDDQGKPKHPYFPEVKQLMGSLIGTGQATDLEDAYTKAVKATNLEGPTQTNQPVNEAARLAEQRRKAQEAKRAAGASSKGSGGVTLSGDAQKRTLEDDLAARLDGGGGRV